MSPTSHHTTQTLPPVTHPFPARYASRTSSLTFNIAGYSRQLVNDFLVEGGKIEHVDFFQPSDLNRLTQKVIINATGYGARALWKDVQDDGTRAKWKARRTPTKPPTAPPPKPLSR